MPQQIHLDLYVDDVTAHDEATSLGARLVKPADDLESSEGYQVYAVPAGHPFWVQAMTTDRNYTIAAAVDDIAAELDTTAAAVALARTLEQVCGDLGGIETDLPDAVRERLDDISAPPNVPVTGAPITSPT